MRKPFTRLFENVKARNAATQSRVAGALGLDVLPSNSTAARAGRGLITVAVGLELLTPLLFFGLVFVGLAEPALAQPSAGNIFGQSAEAPGRGLVEAVKYLRNIVFVFGVAFFAWAALNMGFEKQWGGKAIAGAACWAFAGLSALVYEFSQGNSVKVDTNLGN